MKAAILYGKEQIKIEEVAPRPLQPGEVRIDIQAALTCGTDLKVFKRGYHAKMIVPPAVFGHELAGVISEIRSPKSEIGIGASAIASWPPTRLRAAIVSTVNAARKTSARNCCF